MCQVVALIPNCHCAADLVTGEVVDKLVHHREIVRDCSWHPHEQEVLFSPEDRKHTITMPSIVCHCSCIAALTRHRLAGRHVTFLPSEWAGAPLRRETCCLHKRLGPDALHRSRSL